MSRFAFREVLFDFVWLLLGKKYRENGKIKRKENEGKKEEDGTRILIN